MAIPTSFDFKNYLDVVVPREVIHAPDLFGMIGLARGFFIISGCGISRATNTITIASGVLMVGGTVVSFTTDNVVVNDTAMSSGQYRWTTLHINSSGTLSSTNGTAVSTGDIVVKPINTTQFVICAALKTHGATLADTDVIPTGLEVSNSHILNDNVASQISAIANKATPVDGDFLIGEDSADSNAKVHFTIANLSSVIGGISNVVEDTTPQLGGPLDGQGEFADAVRVQDYFHATLTVGRDASGSVRETGTIVSMTNFVVTIAAVASDFEDFVLPIGGCKVHNVRVLSKSNNSTGDPTFMLRYVTPNGIGENVNTVGANQSYTNISSTWAYRNANDGTGLPATLPEDGFLIVRVLNQNTNGAIEIMGFEVDYELRGN